MMRNILCILTLAAVAATTHAVTFDWTKATTFNTPGETTAQTSLSVHTSFAVKAVFTDFSIKDGVRSGFNSFVELMSGANQSLGRLQNTGSGNNNGKNFFAGANDQALNTTTSIADNITADGTLTVIFAYDAEAHNFSITLNDNADPLISAELDLSGYNTLKIYVGRDNGTQRYLAEDFNYTLQSAQIVLPEPTALALLALGVAGLALRRKVA